MRPNQVARSLRQIAAKIENSKAPRRELVAADIKRILVAAEELEEAEVEEIEDEDRRVVDQAEFDRSRTKLEEVMPTSQNEAKKKADEISHMINNRWVMAYALLDQAKHRTPRAGLQSTIDMLATFFADVDEFLTKHD